MGQVRLPCIHCGRVMSPSALVWPLVSGFLLLHCSLSLWQNDVLFTSFVVMPVRGFLGFDDFIVFEVYLD